MLGVVSKANLKSDAVVAVSVQIITCISLEP